MTRLFIGIFIVQFVLLGSAAAATEAAPVNPLAEDFSERESELRNEIRL